MMMDMYRVQETVLAADERSLYHALTLIVAQRALLLTKVKLSALLAPAAGQTQHVAYTHLDRYTVDFVLCDRSTTRPLLIALQDRKSTSNCALNTINDAIERIASSAGLPVLRFAQGNAYRMDLLLRLIEPYLSGDSRGSDYAQGDRLATATDSRGPAIPRPATLFSSN